MVGLALGHTIPYKADDIDVQILRRQACFPLKVSLADGVLCINFVLKSSVCLKASARFYLWAGGCPSG